MTNIFKKLYFDIFFCIFNCLSFLCMIRVRKKQKIRSVIYISLSLVFYLMYLNTNKWIYNNVLLRNRISTNKLQFYLELFTYKILAFWTFCFQFITQFLPFSLVRFLTNNTFHVFEASTRCYVEILKLGVGR